MENRDDDKEESESGPSEAGLGSGRGLALHISSSCLMGHSTSDRELSVILNSYGRIPSCLFVQAKESGLLARQGHQNTGAREAAEGPNDQPSQGARNVVCGIYSVINIKTLFLKKFTFKIFS